MANILKKPQPKGLRIDHYHHAELLSYTPLKDILDEKYPESEQEAITKLNLSKHGLRVLTEERDLLLEQKEDIKKLEIKAKSLLDKDLSPKEIEQELNNLKTLFSNANLPNAYDILEEVCQQLLTIYQIFDTGDYEGMPSYSSSRSSSPTGEADNYLQNLQRLAAENDNKDLEIKELKRDGSDDNSELGETDTDREKEAKDNSSGVEKEMVRKVIKSLSNDNLPLNQQFTELSELLSQGTRFMFLEATQFMFVKESLEAIDPDARFSFPVLLIYEVPAKKFYHFDTLKGANYEIIKQGLNVNLTDLNENFGSERMKWQKKNDDLKDRKNYLETTLDTLNNTIISLNNELTKKEGQIKQQTKQINQAIALLEEQKKKVEEQAAQLNKEKKDVGTQTDPYVDQHLTADIQRLEKEKSDLDKQIKKLVDLDAESKKLRDKELTDSRREFNKLSQINQQTYDILGQVSTEQGLAPRSQKIVDMLKA
ncbi:2990_t:CDS:2 [Ambispora gerdemannii]|uniref:2990_t:CDS:1 n=1 Tax=Ambispora gerdemannii TaxID=144530 RepID=A0A9N8W6M6_9GLOM|nr:2990_t:CDS:2 [Ambispora gerdemannii]